MVLFLSKTPSCLYLYLDKNRLMDNVQQQQRRRGQQQQYLY
jgi:hypothetical protein